MSLIPQVLSVRIPFHLNLLSFRFQRPFYTYMKVHLNIWVKKLWFWLKQPLLSYSSWPTIAFIWSSYTRKSVLFINSTHSKLLKWPIGAIALAHIFYWPCLFLRISLRYQYDCGPFRIKIISISSSEHREYCSCCMWFSRMNTKLEIMKKWI